MCPSPRRGVLPRLAEVLEVGLMDRWDAVWLLLAGTLVAAALTLLVVS